MYHGASCQAFNFSKSSIQFNKNISQNDKCIIYNELGIVKENDMARYLGMPMLMKIFML